MPLTSPSAGGSGSYTIFDNIGDNASFFASSSIAHLAYESVGATGSGADNIWSAMDTLPSESQYIDVNLQSIFTHTSGSVLAFIVCQCRAEGDDGTGIFYLERQWTTTSNISTKTTQHRIPLNTTNNQFEFLWENRNSVTTLLIQLSLVGGGKH